MSLVNPITAMVRFSVLLSSLFADLFNFSLCHCHKRFLYTENNVQETTERDIIQNQYGQSRICFSIIPIALEYP